MIEAPVAPPSPGQRYKFIVRSAEEAASTIRERLGEQATVISVKQVEGGGLARFLRAPRLEIIAEIPLVRSPGKPPVAESETSAFAPQAVPASEPEVRAPITALRRVAAQPTHRLWTVLERAGLPREFLTRVADLPEWKELPDQPLHVGLARSARLLRERVPAHERSLTSRVAFFGSPGTGATTALCKQLANDVFFHARAACVMKIEADEPNPTEALSLFCEALGVPLLRTAAEIEEVAEDATVYFDVPGTTHGPQNFDRLGKEFDRLAIGTRVLVVNAAYDRALIQGAYMRAARARATHVVFTHVDELDRCGKLWEFALEDGLVPLFASTGQNIAGDCDRNLIELLVRETLSAGNFAP